MRKQGLSTIVATLIIILLVLVAVGVIWVVVRNVIQEGTEQINLGKFTLDLELKRVQTIDDNTISATIKRNSGAGNFVSMTLIVDDGINSETVTINETLQELEQKTFTVDLQVINSSYIQKISLAPVFRLTSGKEVIGDVKDTLNVGSGISQCTSTCQSLGYECGTNTICGQSVDCSDGQTCEDLYGTDYVCSGGTCVYQSSCTDDCDSLNYECGTHTICGVDTNCGDVATACIFPNAQPTCNAGQCELLTCDTNYGNCNGDDADGCESDLTTNATCGSCLVSCNIIALETCTAGSCVAPPPVCGDGSCNGAETCGDDNVAPACNSDCGTCAAVCGNSVVEGTEQCDGSNLNGNSCATVMGAGYTGSLGCYAAGLPNECTFDTGDCIAPSGCGDSTCDVGECTTCPQDCTHSDCCPDGNCNNGELCGVDNVEPACNTDCGTCAAVCGDGTCNYPTETCGNSNTAPECNSDCGVCGVFLGSNSGFVETAPAADPVGISSIMDNNALGTRDTSPATATRVTEIGWWCDTATEESNFEVGLYEDTGGGFPGNAVGSLYQVNAKGTTAGWKRVAVDIPISPNTQYWIAVQLDDTATTTNTNVALTGGDYRALKPGQTALTDPFAADPSTNEGYMFTFYAVWE